MDFVKVVLILNSDHKYTELFCLHVFAVCRTLHIYKITLMANALLEQVTAFFALLKKCWRHLYYHFSWKPLIQVQVYFVRFICVTKLSEKELFNMHGRHVLNCLS